MPSCGQDVEKLDLVDDKKMASKIHCTFEGSQSMRDRTNVKAACTLNPKALRDLRRADPAEREREELR